MRDPRPLSERFDLTYPRRRAWPNRWITPLSLVLVVLGLAYLLVTMAQGSHSLYSPGPLSHGHAGFGNDCGKCHQPSPDRDGYWLPVGDQACLKCHVAPAHEPHGFLYAGTQVQTPGHLAAMKMAGKCVECHVEHQGAQRNLGRVDDRYCVQCHGNLPMYESGPPRSNGANSGPQAMPAPLVPSPGRSARTLTEQSPLPLGEGQGEGTPGFDRRTNQGVRDTTIGSNHSRPVAAGQQSPEAQVAPTPTLAKGGAQ